ncbi:MAG TPA: glycosyltransferase [Ohtaekwangia sp.]|nr:glycosyltransferase [Ohtaekwangia sp.]
MKILWITNNPLPEFFSEIKGNPVPGGSWISALAYALSQDKEIQLAVVTNVSGGVYQKLQQGSVIQYTVPIKQNGWYTINDVYPELIDWYQQVESDFNPDVIHIHGTERYFGLLSGRKLLKAPTVISIQGIITACYDHYLGGLKESTLLKTRSLKNFLLGGGILNQRKVYWKYLPIEHEILRNNTYFFCRTGWDRAQVLSYNKDAVIFQGEELLRKPFYNINWSLAKARRHSIFISSGSIPLKGLHVMLEALSILKQDFPDVLLRIPIDGERFYKVNRLTSNDYEIYLHNLVKKYGLTENLELLGKLNADQMASTFASSHSFVLTSFTENSPNSLGEAMKVGTPSVVSPVGGVPDMVQDNNSALFATSGNAVMFAQQIKRLFQDDDLARTLSENGKRIAAKRHDVPGTVEQYKSGYKQMQQHSVVVPASN